MHPIFIRFIYLFFWVNLELIEFVGLFFSFVKG